MRYARRVGSLPCAPAGRGTALAVAAVAVLAGCAGGSAGAIAHAHGSMTAAVSSVPPAGDRAEGDALARQLLARLTLPPGTRRLAAGPATLSPGNAPAPWAADLHREFLLPIPEAAAIPFQYAHAPAGLRPDGNGEISSYGPPEVREFEWSQSSLPRGIASVELAEDLAPDRGRTLVRFDAEVTWYLARPTADFLDPARVSSVTVLVTEFRGIQERSFARKISPRSAIDKLVGLFNSLRGEAGESLCVQPDRTTYQLAVAMAAGRKLDVDASNCGADVVTAPGEARSVLWDPGNRLPALVASLIRPG
jgi:hypothetical protein